MSTILIVDDRSMDRELLATLLKYSHYRILEAANGVEALELIRNEHPDLVISDLLLPDIDGYELVRRLRTDPSVAGTPVIFYTAVFDEVEARALALEVGVTNMLIKPVTPEKILDTVAEVLKASGTEAVSFPPVNFEQKHYQLLIDKLLLQVEALEQSREEIRQARDLLEMKVQERTKDLQFLNAPIVNAQETERKRIAGELHDNIASKLAAIKFRLEGRLCRMENDRSQTWTALEGTVTDIQELMEESRRMMMGLRPSMLEDLGLLSTINWFCRDFNKSYPDLSIQKIIDLSEEEIPEVLKITIYRLMQEALHNIARHSQADRVELSLIRENGQIKLIIQDNGRGFDIEAAIAGKKGLGLINMRERVRFSGGLFHQESAEGTGTMIKAFWPLADGCPG